MQYKRFFLAVFCLLSFLGLTLNAQPASALGQITEPIVIKSALRGQSATAILTILNSEAKEIKVDLKAEGQIKTWATFYKIDDKDMANPVGQITLPIKAYQDAAVKFEIPKDTPNGTYTGVIAVSSIPETSASATESSSNVSQRIDREVSITVSDKEIIALNISVIPASYDLVEKESLKIRIIYDNQGNVAISPDMQLKISRDGQPIYNAIFPYPESEESVKPGQIKELPTPIEWTTSGQINGKYQAEIKILINGQIIKEDNFGFSVGLVSPSSASIGSLLAAVAAIGQGNMTLGWIIIGGLVFLIGVSLIVISRRKKRLKTKYQTF